MLAIPYNVVAKLLPKRGIPPAYTNPVRGLKYCDIKLPIEILTCLVILSNQLLVKGCDPIKVLPFLDNC